MGIGLLSDNFRKNFLCRLAAPPNCAHFARVPGIDMRKQEIYIENTLYGAPYWTVPFQEFAPARENPETTASLIPDPDPSRDAPDRDA